MSDDKKQRFLDAYAREHATTRKVLHAYPSEQSEFKPHERSNTAHMLAWTFVVEEQLMLLAVKRELKLGGGFPKPPATFAEVLSEFDAVSGQLVATLRLPETTLDDTVTFFVAPKQTGEIPIDQFLWFMLSDQIHHRGQLSVYLRMAGGKVPSIYGPSADEPWN